MNLDDIGTRPSEIAERALASWLVFVLQVPLELLNPSKFSFAICTSRSAPHRRAVHVTAGTVLRRALGGYIPSESGFMGPSLGYIGSIRSWQTGGAYLQLRLRVPVVGRQVGGRP